jgi:hypothetical protein
LREGEEEGANQRVPQKVNNKKGKKKSKGEPLQWAKRKKWGEGLVQLARIIN